MVQAGPGSTTKAPPFPLHTHEEMNCLYPRDSMSRSISSSMRSSVFVQFYPHMMLKADFGPIITYSSGNEKTWTDQVRRSDVSKRIVGRQTMEISPIIFRL